MAFHAGLGVLSGGYVGVDVFFVISGYLITTIIMSEIEAGNFTIRKFYERRARRILPALYVVVLALLPFAWLWMTPEDLDRFSRSLVAVGSFSSNIEFWRGTNYFARGAELKPLLHTWSLAIEEQYYLLFPLLILLLWRFGKDMLVRILGAIGLLSILAAHWGSMYWPNAAFYLLPTRFWELLLGSLIAIYLLRRGTQAGGIAMRRGSVQEWLAAFGLLMILGSIISFDENTPFPSVYTLLPTVGTGLIILFASRETLAGRLLSSRLLVGVGLISYSAYLWHQPLFAFARLRSYLTPSHMLMSTLGIFSLILAYLTWRYVEQPFRDKARFDRGKIFTLAVTVTLLIVAIGLTGHLSGGFGTRRTANGTQMANLNFEHRLRPNRGLGVNCGVELDISKMCVTDESPEILVWGDSLAMNLTPAIQSSNPDARIVQIAMPACGSIIGLAPINRSHTEVWADECFKFNEDVMDWLRNNQTVRYAVLSSAYDHYLQDGGGWRLATERGIVPSDPVLVLEHLTATLDALAELGIRPVVVAPPPFNGHDISSCLVSSTMFGGDLARCDIAVSDYMHYSGDVITLLEKVSVTYRVIWVSDVLCNSSTCRSSLDGNFIYGDHQHYSFEGAEALGARLDFYDAITGESGMRRKYSQPTLENVPN